MAENWEGQFPKEFLAIFCLFFSLLPLIMWSGVTQGPAAADLCYHELLHTPLGDFNFAELLDTVLLLTYCRHRRRRLRQDRQRARYQQELRRQRLFLLPAPRPERQGPPPR